MTDSEIPLDEPLATRLALAVEQYGERKLVEKAVGLLNGRNEGEEVLLYVGGRHAQGILSGAPAVYWPELWGARVLLHLWDDSASPSVLQGLGNQAWRVREMCLRVCAARGLGELEALSPLLRDENPRVRAAAARTIAERGLSEGDEAIRVLLRDPDKDVRRAAGEASRALTKRS